MRGVEVRTPRGLALKTDLAAVRLDYLRRLAFWRVLDDADDTAPYNDTICACIRDEIEVLPGRYTEAYGKRNVGVCAYAGDEVGQCAVHGS